jgi:predicted ATPase
MIERVQLQNFKASRSLNIRLAPLTLLAGLNSSGKSSILQAIAMLRQSYATTANAPCLMLSGDLVHLGHGRDILSEGSETEGDIIAFETPENGKSYRWECKSIPDASELPFSATPESLPNFIQSPHFQFLQADRAPANPLYPQAPQHARSTGFLGAKGEYTADYLALNPTKDASEKRSVTLSTLPVDSDLLALVSPTSKLPDQLAAWLQQLSPGVRQSAERLKGTDEVQLFYEFVGHARTSKSNPYRPTNVGFGLTYCLPILVACLAAPPGAFLLLENPEAHLHPQGQVALGELLSFVAADGVQLIVETHSDHILNGIRLAVKGARLRAEDVALHFFTRSVKTGDSAVQTPSVQPDGRLSNWPKGFFDQWDKSLDALLD